MDDGRKTLLGCLSVPFIFAVGIAATIWQANQPDPNIQQIEIARNVAMCKTVYGPMSEAEDDGRIFRSLADEPKHILCGQFKKGDKGTLTKMRGGGHCLEINGDYRGGCFDYDPADLILHN
jgi:hypothetical protein